MFKTLTVAVMLVGLAAGSVSAAPTTGPDFSGTGLPSGAAAFAAGSQVVSFTTSNQSFASYSEAGVTFGPGRVSSDYSDNYNTTGSYFDNDQGGYNTISFSFAQPVSAFAFNWGAADVNWNVDVFVGRTLLSSYSISPTRGSNYKEYFGFTGAGITSVQMSTDRSDFVFFDNLTYASGAVPEPATWSLMIGGFGMIGFAMRRRTTAVNA